MRMINIVEGERVRREWHPVFLKRLQELGELTLIDYGEKLSEEEIYDVISQHEVVLTSHYAVNLPEKLAKDPQKLKYVCHMHGTMRHCVSESFIKNKDILVTNWGTNPAIRVAEAAVAITLATLKDIKKRTKLIENGGWKMKEGFYGGSLVGLNIGLYGAGTIGRKYIEFIKPYNPVIRIFDPFLNSVPDGCIRVNSLEELFKNSQLVAIHAGLTSETEKSVTAELLAMLPKYGTIINTARGGIIDQEALFKELESGRLRAGLDVTEPEELPVDHPARRYDNLILTSHTLARGWPDEGKDPTQLRNSEPECIKNLTCYKNNQPIEDEYIMTLERYRLST